MTKKSFVWVTFQKEGIHCYPEAASDPKLSDVSFLGVPHRHIFHFKIWIEVFQNNRDIEFIQFKRWLESLYTGDILNLNSKSCEMISDELYQKITEKYPNRDIRISIAEDNENGSEIFYDKEDSNNLQNTDSSSVNQGTNSSPTTEQEQKNVDSSEVRAHNTELDHISFDDIKATETYDDEVKEVISNPEGTLQNIISKFTDHIKSE